MGVVSFAQEIDSPISQDRLFKALILDSPNLFPKLVPECIQSIDVIQGDGGVGSFIQVNFTQGSIFKYVKYRIDELDTDNLQSKLTIIEGDFLGKNMKSIGYEIKCVSNEKGGCICKRLSKYYTDPDVEFKEEDIEFGKEKAIEIFKAVDAYLLANPHLYA